MLYNRKIQEKITKWLFRDEIIILNGPRQVGKTSLLKLILKDLKKQNINENQIFNLNLEDLEILNDLNESPKNLLRYIKNKNKKNYFLIDEIQYLNNPSNFLKYIYDEHKNNIKLIVTGSSSLELKAKLQDSLAGRKITFSITPLIFEEFLDFKQIKNREYYQQKNIPTEILNEFKKYLDEYLLYGGMPKVVLAPNDDIKKALLKNYISDYINKDVRYIGKIDDLFKFNQLVKVLASQIGNLLNINELTNTLNIPRKDIEFYINLLKQTFVLYKIRPYSRNIRSQIIKMPKIYWFDLGIRNQILNNFANTPNRTDNGNMFENFIYLELKYNLGEDNLYFFRTTHKAEIDFIIEQDAIVYPIEVKYKTYTKPRGNRTLSNFCDIKNINCQKAFLVNLNFEQKTEKINFLPFNKATGIVATKN